MTKTYSHPFDSEEISNAMVRSGQNAALVEPVAVCVLKEKKTTTIDEEDDVV